MYGTGNLGEVVQPLPDADVAKTTDKWSTTVELKHLCNCGIVRIT